MLFLWYPWKFYILPPPPPGLVFFWNSPLSFLFVSKTLQFNDLKPRMNRYKCKDFSNCSGLFKSFEFGNGSRMSDKNHVILEFKYLQNKKWQKQAVKSARIKTSYRTYYFHFTQLTDKNWQFSFKNWQFSTFTMFLLHLWSSMDADFRISLAYVTSGTKQFFCF